MAIASVILAAMAVAAYTIDPAGCRWAMAVAVVTAWPRLSVRRYVTHRYVAYTYVVLFMAWWVVRNIAGW